jgi:hypothetical protein
VATQREERPRERKGRCWDSGGVGKVGAQTRRQEKSVGLIKYNFCTVKKFAMHSSTLRLREDGGWGEVLERTLE